LKTVKKERERNRINGDDQKSWQSIPKAKVETKIVIKKVKDKTSKKVKNYLSYDTQDRFVQGHIKEVNICCSHKAFTAAFILCRKIIENLLIEDIIKIQYTQKRDNIPIYFNPSKNRTKDFSEILQNLRDRKNDFGPQKQLLERLLNNTKPFKDDANNKTHSTYHLVRTLKELNPDNVQDILDMIRDLKKNIS